jgi:AcrR family transcriptional regulator
VGDVKAGPPRSLRSERAAVTRTRITDAARRSFRSKGYAATTMTDIADAAGVAVQTVYAVFRSKSGILSELRNAARDLPEADALGAASMAAATPGEALDLFARSIRTRWVFAAGILSIDRDAASADPDVRADLDRVLARRRAGIGRVARSLLGGAAADAEVRRAAAIIDALTMPEAYLVLTEVHGWTPDVYEAWLGGALRTQLLGPETAGHDAG